MNQGLIPAKWAALTPHNQAVYDATSDRRIDWQDFDELVRRLANGLRSFGLAPGDRVAMLSRNCIEYQALYFAAGRVGLVTQPLNWRLAAPALAGLLEEGHPRALIAESGFADVVAELQRKVDLPHWLQFGPDSDGSLDDLVRSASADEQIGRAHV